MFVDPHPSPTSGRPVGIELGIDFDRDLDSGGHYQVTAELAGVSFLSKDPNQLLATLGPAWSPTPATQVSLVGLVGFLEGSDKYGALLGISQKIGLGQAAIQRRQPPDRCTLEGSDERASSRQDRAPA